MRKAAIILSLTLGVMTPLALASGGYGGSGGGTYGGSGAVPKKIDKRYEYGKAIYLGRIKEVGKIKFCITSGDEKVKMKSKAIKAYRGSPANEFASNLFDCDNPDQLIYHKLGKSNFAYVLYYLNKRYKLELS